MQCEVPKHTPPLNVRGIEGLKKRDKRDSFALQARNCKQTVIQVPLSPFWVKEIYKFNQVIVQILKVYSLTLVDY